MGLEKASIAGRISEAGAPLRPNPDWLIAQIDKDEQVEYIHLDRHLTLGRTHAFVVSGSHDEWPEAIGYKLACRLGGKHDELHFNLSPNLNLDDAGEILFEGFQKKLQIDKDEIIKLLDQDAEQPHIFHINICPEISTPKPQFLARLVEAWEALLPQNNADRQHHYLLLVLTTATSTGGQFRRWWSRWQLWWFTHRTCQSMRNAKLLPKLKSPSANHVYQWKNEHIAHFGLKNRIEIESKRLFYKNHRISHRTLKHAFYPILNAQLTSTP